MLPKIKKYTKNTAIYRNRIPSKLPFHAFNIWTFWVRVSKVTDFQKHIYLDKNFFEPDQYVSLLVNERKFAFSLTKTFPQFCYCFAKPYTEGLHCFAYLCIYLSWIENVMRHLSSGLVRWYYINFSSYQSSFDNN